MDCCEDSWRNMKFTYKSKWLFSLWKAEITCSVILLLSAPSEWFEQIRTVKEILSGFRLYLFLSSQILWNHLNFNRNKRHLKNWYCVQSQSWEPWWIHNFWWTGIVGDRANFSTPILNPLESVYYSGVELEHYNNETYVSICLPVAIREWCLLTPLRAPNSDSRAGFVF